MAYVGQGQLTLIDELDKAALSCILSPSQSLQQTYNAPNYSPDRTAGGAALVITPIVTYPAPSGPVDVVPDLINVKWGTSAGSNDLYTTPPSGVTALITGAKTLTIADNTVVTHVDGNQTKTIFFEAEYTDPYNGYVSKVAQTINISVIIVGSNATYVKVSGQTTIPKSPDGNFVDKGTIYATLYRGGSEDTSFISGGYQWRVGPNFGDTDVLDSDHPWVTANPPLVRFKTNAQVSDPVKLADESEYVGTVNWTGPTAYADARGLIISETAFTGSVVLKCVIKDDTESWYEYVTITDKNDPYSVELASDAGGTIRNSNGVVDITPRILSHGPHGYQTQLSGWTFEYTLFNKDGYRTAFSSDTNRVISDTTTSTIVLGSALTNSDHYAAGMLVKVVKDATERLYVITTGSTSTTLNLHSDPKSVYPWIPDELITAPTADQFNGGRAYICCGNADPELAGMIKKVIYRGSSILSLHATTWNGTEKSLRVTTNPSGIVTAGDVIYVQKPTDGMHNSRYWIVNSITTSDPFKIFLKAATTDSYKKFAQRVYNPYPGDAVNGVASDASEWNNGTVYSITGFLNGVSEAVPSPCIELNQADIHLKSTLMCKVNRPGT